MPNIEQVESSTFVAGQVPQWNGGQFVGKLPVLSLHLPAPEYPLEIINLVNLAFGTTPLALTIPAGYRMVMQASSLNTTGAQIAWHVQMVRGGVTYRIFGGVNNGPSFPAGPSTYVGVESTDGSFAIVTNNPGLSLSIACWLVPVTAPWKVAGVPLSNGDNTVYTCPAGKVARMLSAGALTSTFVIGIIATTDPLGAVKCYHVPNGGAADPLRYIFQPLAAVTLANTLLVPSAIPCTLQAGDSLLLNVVATAPAMLFYHIWEEDA